MSQTVIAYGDINCPFCYALHERCISLGLNHQIEWHFIEHAPSVNFANFSIEEQSELADEVYTARLRAPEIVLNLPPARPNSHLASLYIIATRNIDPGKSKTLQTLIYQALWQHGQDVSSPDILEPLLLQAGFETPPITDTDKQQLNIWTQDWSEGSFERRIPVLSQQPRQSLGLIESLDIAKFIAGKVLTEEQVTACEYKQRYMVVLLGDAKDCWHFIKPMQALANVRVLAGIGPLRELLAEPETIDLILLQRKQVKKEIYHLCNTISHDEHRSHTPIIVIDEEYDSGVELAVIQQGAHDYLLTSNSSDLIDAKCKNYLKHKRSTDLLEKAARIDGLTQIYNRREFDRIIEMEWGRAFRAKQSLSIILIDIDHFKRYNDFYGHLSGDGCLRLIAQTLNQQVQRLTDIVARFGGEEFIVIVSESELDGSCAVAQRLINSIEDLQIPHAKSSTSDFVTISAGAASIMPNSTNSIQQLIKQADQNLYLAKANGRNRLEPPLANS